MGEKKLLHKKKKKITYSFIDFLFNSETWLACSTLCFISSYVKFHEWVGGQIQFSLTRIPTIDKVSLSHVNSTNASSASCMNMNIFGNSAHLQSNKNMREITHIDRLLTVIHLNNFPSLFSREPWPDLSDEPDVWLFATEGLFCASGNCLWFWYQNCSQRRFYIFCVNVSLNMLFMRWHYSRNHVDSWSEAEDWVEGLFKHWWPPWKNHSRLWLNLPFPKHPLLFGLLNFSKHPLSCLYSYLQFNTSVCHPRSLTMSATSE